MELLGGVINSQDMTLSLPKDKILKIQEQCKEILSETLTSIRTLSKLINRLGSTAVAILPALLQYRALKHNQIQGILPKNFLEEKVTLLYQVKRKLNWWIQNLNLYNGKSLITPLARIIISSDASSKVGGIIQRATYERSLVKRREIPHKCARIESSQI